VVCAIELLIFKHLFNGKEDNYEKDKGNAHPFNTFVVFCMQLLVLFVCQEDRHCKKNDKHNGKN
jgi:hypothetical protein